MPASLQQSSTHSKANRSECGARAVFSSASKECVVYFGQTPGQGTGSPINMLRHLRRFTDAGWDVLVVSEWGKPVTLYSMEGWQVYDLPYRRCWWPPYRPDSKLLRDARVTLWAKECRRAFSDRKPHAIVTYLSYHSELMSEIAAQYSIEANIPLTVIVYDDAMAFDNGVAPDERKQADKRFRWILQQARQNWFVSGQLAEAYGFSPDPSRVLMPIPEGICKQVVWRAEFSGRPVLIYAGFIYDQQYPLLRRLGQAIEKAGGQFLILSQETPNVRKLCAESTILFRRLLPTNREALEFVGKHAAGFVAAYSDRIDDMPWTRSSFPSKVVEFGHLGLPILLVSPPECAVYTWSQERNLPFNLRPEELGRVVEFVTALKDPVQWEALAKPIRSLALTEFNPDVIQERLVKHLV